MRGGDSESSDSDSDGDKSAKSSCCLPSTGLTSGVVSTICCATFEGEKLDRAACGGSGGRGFPGITRTCLDRAD